MLARLRKTREENEGGFTLIELLVVVIIIGILAAIAIPTFLNQREKAWAKASVSDLRNGSVVLEEHFSDAGTYAPVTTPTAYPIALTDFKMSDGVVLTGMVSSSGYCLFADHSKLVAADSYILKSSNGKAEKVSAATVTACATTDTGSVAGTAIPAT